MVALAAPLVRESKLRRESIAARIEDGFLDATTLMEFFIAAGVPMRTAHEAVGRLVRQCEEKRCRLIDLPVAAFEEFVPGRAAEVSGVLGVQNAIAAFRSYGSTAPAQVEEQLSQWQKRLS